MPDMQEFFTRQHEHLNRLETAVEKTKTELEAARNESLESLRRKREQAAANRESFNKKISDAANQMKANIEAKKQETDASIEDWKNRREVSKLENRARSLETYAEAAMNVVDYAHNEAFAASLDAIEARRQAEEAKAGARA
jgi:adenylate kinase family enzyme